MIFGAVGNTSAPVFRIELGLGLRALTQTRKPTKRSVVAQDGNTLVVGRMIRAAVPTLVS